jgi:methyltransferase family protein
MRPHVREFLGLCAQTLQCPEPIVEIGAFQVPGQEAIAELRPLFPGKRYLGCDMRPGRGVDRIEDIHALSFETGSVGTFILADTLEHVADPIRAMAEIHRCINDHGIVIYISTMHFPIHGYPNDYWRFTPEAFRLLGAEFPSVAIFYSGSPEFPHTVCGVAAKSLYDRQSIRTLAGRSEEIRTTAPLIVERYAAQIIHSLARRILPPEKVPVEVPIKTTAGFRHLTQPGWFLVTGQWIEGWVVAENVREVEIVADDFTIHRTQLNQPQPDIAAQLGLPDCDAPIGFRDQVELTSAGDRIGVLQMVVVDHQGRRRTVCSSAPGLLLGSMKLPTQFVMHSFDERQVDDARTRRAL